MDRQGHVVEFEVYGINEVTSDIEHVNLESIAHPFTKVTRGEIARPAGPVDVLIGYKYSAYHPEREQNIGHLVLLKNRFGRCVGGTHPLLSKEMYMTHIILETRESARLYAKSTCSIRTSMQMNQLPRNIKAKATLLCRNSIQRLILLLPTDEQSVDSQFTGCSKVAALISLLYTNYIFNDTKITMLTTLLLRKVT